MEDEWLKKTFGSQNMYCGVVYIDMILVRIKTIVFNINKTHEILISA